MMQIAINELAIIVIVGGLSAMSLYLGNAEMASLGMGGLVGYLSKNIVSTTKEESA